MQFGKKNTYKKYIYSKATIFVLLGIIVLIGRSVYERFGVERDMSTRRVQTEHKLGVLQERKETIEARVDYLQGERGIEEEIRKNFDVAKEGEQVIILTGAHEPENDLDDTVTAVDDPWYIFWR